ncbi:MAG: hypothetical protein ACJ8C0_12710 [Microvirga sp.]
MRRAERAGGRRPGLHRLSWFANGDHLDVAVVANRLAAAGREVWRCPVASGEAEAGDYLVKVSGRLAEALRGAGIAIEPWAGARPADAQPVRHARIAVLAGEASAYPYYAYYALALARLGHAFAAVDGTAIAAGVLRGENIAVLPGGFSNWGLDAKEGSTGADAAFRGFLAGGGAALASCGGAYYLSRGRPAWLGVADARPVFTQEYLRTGVGVVTCGLEPGPLRLGLPPTLEIPYFHGPVYDELGPGCAPLASFRERYGDGRLFIDNPLSEETFTRHMQGRVAALRASGRRGEAVLFSAHPEMGDLLRKYMALESYVPRYLPVRGALVMRETLDSFAPAESRSFLMILNAVEDLLRGARAGSPDGARAPDGARPSDDPSAAIRRLGEGWRARRAAFRPSPGGIGDLERGLLAEFERRLDPALRRLDDRLTRVAECGRDGPRIAVSFTAIAGHACAAWTDPPERRPGELLLELELALLLIEAWARLAEIHAIVSTHD